jgi:hypothetical protein
METDVHRRLQTAVVLLAMLASAPLFAAEKPNLISNGGFEESVTVDITKDNPQYKVLLDRGVSLPVGEQALMPASVYVNPADGWQTAKHRFEYVEGTPGDAVHSGTRAVRIESTGGFSAIAVGKIISVVEGVGLEDNAIQVGKPYRFSLYAKGSGTIAVNGYLYDAKRANIYDYSRCLKVEPPRLDSSRSDEWQKLEGTIQVNCPDVQSILLVIAVQGNVTLDDVALHTP